MMGRFLCGLSRTVAISSYKVSICFVNVLTANNTFHEVLVSSISSPPWYDITMFGFCSLHVFLGCPGQSDTVDGFNALNFVDVNCNRMVLYLKYTKGSDFLENHFLCWIQRSRLGFFFCPVWRFVYIDPVDGPEYRTASCPLIDVSFVQSFCFLWSIAAHFFQYDMPLRGYPFCMHLWQRTVLF